MSDDRLEVVPTTAENWRNGRLRHPIPSREELEKRSAAGDNGAADMLATHRRLGTWKKDEPASDGTR